MPKINLDPIRLVNELNRKKEEIAKLEAQLEERKIQYERQIEELKSQYEARINQYERQLEEVKKQQPNHNYIVCFLCFLLFMNLMFPYGITHLILSLVYNQEMVETASWFSLNNNTFFNFIKPY
jgi:hypothetical protein